MKLLPWCLDLCLFWRFKARESDLFKITIRLGSLLLSESIRPLFNSMNQSELKANTVVTYFGPLYARALIGLKNHALSVLRS